MKTLLYENEIRYQFRAELSRARKFDFAFGLISVNGLKEIEEEVIKSLESGGYGRVLVGVDMPTHPDAIRRLRLLEQEHKEHFLLRRFQAGKRKMYHAKMAIFETRTGRKTAILGSSNLTAGGLLSNHEANVLLDHRTIIGELLDYFDEQFSGGYSRKIDDLWLRNYVKLWKKREKVERQLRRIRERVRKISAPRPVPKPLPTRIKGFAFAFTGAIYDWPREHRLYPTLRRLGAQIIANADRIRSADCLVHGEIFGGKKETKKLRGARRENVPIITEEEFFGIFEKEKRKRRSN